VGRTTKQRLEIASERLMEALRDARMSQADLAKQSGIGEDVISNLKRKLYMPKHEKMIRLAETLGVEENWLNGSTDEKTRPVLSFGRLTGGQGIDVKLLLEAKLKHDVEDLAQAAGIPKEEWNDVFETVMLMIYCHDPETRAALKRLAYLSSKHEQD